MGPKYHREEHPFFLFFFSDVKKAKKFLGLEKH